MWPPAGQGRVPAPSSGYGPDLGRCSPSLERGLSPFWALYGGRKEKQDKGKASSATPFAGHNCPQCGQFQGFPWALEMGSKSERKQSSAVVIPQRLLTQEKNRGQTPERSHYGQKRKIPSLPVAGEKATLERRYTEDGSRSLTAFIENAIDFYLDYLSANNAGLFLPTSVQSYMDGRLDQFENRMASLLFKQAVELDMGMSTLADCVKLDEEYLRRRRADSVANVKRTNGRLRFEQIVRDANGSDDEWQD